MLPPRPEPVNFQWCTTASLPPDYNDEITQKSARAQLGEHSPRVITAIIIHEEKSVPVSALSNQRARHRAPPPTYTHLPCGTLALQRWMSTPAREQPRRYGFMRASCSGGAMFAGIKHTTSPGMFIHIAVSLFPSRIKRNNVSFLRPRYIAFPANTAIIKTPPRAPNSPCW